MGESYELPVTGTPPVVDGKLDDACWQGALVLDQFVKLSGAEMTDADKVVTRAMLTADATNLYIGVHCGEPLIEKLCKRYTERDSAVWKDDDVEIMIVPGAKGTDRYIQLAINPNGALMDGFIPARRARLEFSYDSGATVKTVVGKAHWAVEMALPVANLPIESITGPWAFHIARARRTTGTYLTSLKTTVSGFHEINAFAELTGIEKLKLPFGLTNFSFGKLVYGANECTFEVAGDKTKLTAMAIEVDGQPRMLFDGPALQIMTGTMRLPFMLAATDRDKSLAVKAYSNTTLLQSRVITLSALPERLLDMAPRNVYFFYDGNFIEYRLPINVVGSSANPLRLSWQAKNDTGQVVADGETTPAGQIALVRLYWPRWRSGTYEIESILRQDGKEIARVTQTIRFVRNPWEVVQ